MYSHLQATLRRR